MSPSGYVHSSFEDPSEGRLWAKARHGKGSMSVTVQERMFTFTSEALSAQWHSPFSLKSAETSISSVAFGQLHQPPMLLGLISLSFKLALVYPVPAPHKAVFCLNNWLPCASGFLGASVCWRRAWAALTPALCRIAGLWIELYNQSTTGRGIQLLQEQVLIRVRELLWFCSHCFSLLSHFLSARSGTSAISVNTVARWRH